MTFPGSKEELLNSIQEKLGQDFLVMSDLECPTSELMMRYFVAALTAIGIDINGMINSSISKLKELSHADTYRYNQHLCVYMTVKKVYPVARSFEDFNLCCLIDPKPQDIYFVALFDHFFTFWMIQAQTVLGPRISNMEQKLQHLRELYQQKQKLQHELNDFAAMRSKRAVEETQLEQSLQALNVQLDRLQLESQSLTEQVAKEEAECKELRNEVESNRLKKEQRFELLEAEKEYQRLTQELQQLQAKRDEQEALLEEKRTSLKEKASRRRFLESCIQYEEQAIQALSEHLQLATKVENSKKNVLEASKKLKLILESIKAEEKKQKDLEVQRNDLENDIVSGEKNLAAVTDQYNEQEKLFLHTSEIKKEIASWKAKTSELNETTSEKEQEFYDLEDSFQKAQDKIVEKTEAVFEYHKSKINNHQHSK